MEYDIEINKFGDKIYYKKGTELLHREDGPAIEGADGFKGWFLNGKWHRVDGPAVEYSDEDKHWFFSRSDNMGPVVDRSTEWWINGIRLSKEKEIILTKWWNNKNGI